MSLLVADESHSASNGGDDNAAVQAVAERRVQTILDVAAADLKSSAVEEGEKHCGTVVASRLELSECPLGHNHVSLRVLTAQVALGSWQGGKAVETDQAALVVEKFCKHSFDYKSQQSNHDHAVVEFDVIALANGYLRKAGPLFGSKADLHQKTPLPSLNLCPAPTGTR